MESLGNYLLQMACWLTAFWLIYAVFLRHETFFRLNRWFLISGLLISMVLPVIPIRYVVEVAPVTPSDFTKLMVNRSETAVATPVKINYFLLAYGMGVLFFAFRFVIQIVKLKRFQKNSEPLHNSGYPIFKLDTDTAPFSFFRTIYVSKKLCGDTELKAVVAHERVHIDECHWADLLLLEVVRAVQWFNPLLLLYRKAMMQNHEYLADFGTIQKGVSARTYKAILANQMLGVPVLQVANGFTLFNPTKRIVMMNKDKSHPIKQIRLLLTLPLAALIMVAFAEPKYETRAKTETFTNLKEGTITVKGKIFDQFGNPVPDALVYATNHQNRSFSNNNGSFLISNVSDLHEVNVEKEGYSVVNKISKSESELVVLVMKDKADNNKAITIKGKVTDENGKPLHGASIVVAGGTKGTLADAEGNYTLEGISPDAKITISYVGYKTEWQKAKAQIDVKMERMAYTIVANDKTAPPPPPPPPTVLSVSANKMEKLDEETRIYGADSIRVKGDGPPPLLVLDGKISNVPLNELDAQTFESINVLKGEAARAKYGKKAEYGVLEITTKKANEAEEEVFIIVEEIPEFFGGRKAMDDFIASRTANSNEKGIVKVRFTVAENGSIQNISILESGSKSLGEKAIKIIKEMPAWKPARQRGKAVVADMVLVIEF
jgi:TonB family protein